jgi:hypothetical protein
MILKLTNGVKTSVKLAIQGDFGKDPDDVFALLNGYEHVDFIIANLYPSNMRARLAKSVLRDLGDLITPVYVGSNICEDKITVLDYEFDYPNLVDENAVIKTANPYCDILEGNNPTILVINSAMTDLADFLVNYYNPSLHNIHQIIIQSGYEIDKSGYISPNCAANNAYDYYSAQICFDIFQEKKLPIVIITKKIAYDNSVPSDIYTLLNEPFHGSWVPQYESWVPQYLERCQSKAIQELYKLALLPMGDPNRQGLPDNRDINWFFQFIAKKPLPTTIPSVEDIESYITSLNVYDVFTVLFAISYNPKHKFGLIKLKDNIYEAVAKQSVDYQSWIFQNSRRNLE